MRSVFNRRAKRYFTISQLLVLAAFLFSMFLPQSGFTFAVPQQVEFTVKKTVPNGSALWVTNLGDRDTKLTVGTRPFNSTAQERLYASEVIAGGKTVRLDDALPASFRSTDTLFMRSHEDVATLIAPVDFPVQRAEFFSSPRRQANGQTESVPKWVRELGGIGKTGNNVFEADGTGYAPVVKGQTEIDKHYVLGAGVSLNRGNSSVEFKLIGRAGQTIKSLVLSSSTRVFWQAQLGEFISGTDNYPSRIEMTVLNGAAQGFLSIKDGESGKPLLLPIAPLVGDVSFQARSDGETAEETHSAIGGPRLEEESSVPVQSGSGGYAYFSNGIYDGRGDSYTYNVYGAPANVCGTLRLIRYTPGNNGVSEVTPNWICTDGNGQAQMGGNGWNPSTDQTAQSIRIEWPNSTTTVGGDYKVDDITDPDIAAAQTPGFGVPIPTDFSGTASDRKWGSGFKFGSGGWSTIRGTFLNVSTGRYYNGVSYASFSEVSFNGTAVPSGGGYDINWAVTPPPQAAHNSYDTYEWCVYSNDYFYPCFNCIYFYGPR